MAERLSILLVEDQVRHQKVYEAAIQDALDASVRFAVTGKEALHILSREEPPDLVILDLEIPELRGEEVLKKIKGDPRLRFIPVIILTGLSGFEKQMELLDMGADDFIEKGAPPLILIARLKAQLRHKLAVDRLERLALDRDLFAAGVLQDIGAIKWTIVSLCRNAKDALKRDPVAEKPQLLGFLDKLSSHGSRLGAYASDVIQSVRETHRTPQIAAQDVDKLLDWVSEVLTTEADQAKKLDWKAEGPLKPVLADRSFLRLAILNIVQNAVKFARPEVPLQITVTQSSHDNPEDSRGRRFLTTCIKDNGRGMQEKDLSQIFQPYVRGAEASTEGSGGGFSIGLAVVSKVMVKMGGRVWAEKRQDGPGTVMCIDLPEA